MASQLSTADATTSKLLTLPPENLSLLVDFCDQESLRNLYVTCKSLHDSIALALEYRRIDISAHNLGHFPYTHWNGRVTYYWSDQYPPRFDVEDLARKQHKFLTDVLDRPYVGKLVHVFTWTIRSYCDPDGYWPGRMTKDAVYPDTHMWKAFQCLNNVTKLDLACYQDTWDWEYLRQPPDILFPAATDIRLSGIMYRQIVETIFGSIDMSRLEHLSLDGLQDPGHFKDQHPYRLPSNGAANAIPGQFCEDTDEVKLPGTMYGVLQLLQDRCASLRTFHYRKPGSWMKSRNKSALQDERCYAELAAFLTSVSTTLETFTFEQGVSERVMETLRTGGDPSSRRCVPAPAQKMRPMDEQFINSVLPVLMHAQWPALKDLKIIGVGKFRGKPAMDAPMKARLKRHLGRGVTVQYQEIPERPCEEFYGLAANA